MSADNWTTCPRCRNEREQRNREAADKLAAMYGTIPAEQYESARAALDETLAEPLPQNFREDFEFTGAADGQITAYYSGSCTDCGLEARLHHSVTFYPEG